MKKLKFLMLALLVGFSTVLGSGALNFIGNSKGVPI